MVEAVVHRPLERGSYGSLKGSSLFFAVFIFLRIRYDITAIGV